MMTIHEMFEEVDSLPAAEKWQLVRHLLETLEHEQITPGSRSGYQQFLRETYGILRDTPIERGEQGDYEEREPLE